MKRALVILIGGLAIVAILAFMFRTQITLRVMDRVVATRLSNDFVGGLPDGIHVGLCGAGSPLPDPNRSGPCVAVLAGDQVYIVDSGSGSSRILNQMGIPQGQIDGILLTHFHSDHIDGLGELLMQRWVNGNHTSPVPVYGPQGVQDVVSGLKRAYKRSNHYRTAHHGEDIVPSSGAGGVARPFPEPPPGTGKVVVDKDGLKITAFRVDHEPVDPAVGYRFDYKDRSVVISGDTKKSANLEKMAQGTDLLVHEALAPQLVGIMTEGAERAGRPNLAKATRDILDYHATPVEAAESAQTVGADHLLYYHIVPPLLLAPMEDIFLEGVDDAYEGPVTVGRDGTFVSLETGSDDILVEERL